MNTRTLSLHPRGPFDLAESIAFLRGFAPVEVAGCDPSRLRLALCDDDGTTGGASPARRGRPRLRTCRGR